MKILLKIILTLAGLTIIVGTLAGLKLRQFNIMAATPYVEAPSVVTTANVNELDYSPTIQVVGTVVAAQGVTVSTEVGGKVSKIAFESGQDVKAGDLLIEIDAETEKAQLAAAEASADLARLSLNRSRDLRGTNTISQADLDAAEAQAKQADAQVANIKAVIAKKTIRAPFDGRLGIRQVNLGQFLNPGTPIVSLQSVDPVYVDFSVPQQEVSKLSDGMVTKVTSDAFAGEEFEGTLTAVNSEIDPATRNIRLQATFANADGRLRPGMFVSVVLVEKGVKKAITIPSTSILYAPFGDSVFVVEDKKDEATGKSHMVVRQQFVRLGDTHGDYVAVVDGLKAGEVVVSSGVFKLRTGMTVSVNNDLAPDTKLKPTPDNT